MLTDSCLVGKSAPAEDNLQIHRRHETVARPEQTSLASQTLRIARLHQAASTPVDLALERWVRPWQVVPHQPDNSSSRQLSLPGSTTAGCAELV